MKTTVKTPQEKEKNTIENSRVKTAVPALDRAVAVLNFVSRRLTPPTAADIGKALGIPRSSAHALLAALVAHGLLFKNQMQRYRLGAQSLRWAGDFIDRQEIVTAFQNEVLTVPTLAPYSLSLTYRDGNEVVCMACRNGDGRLGFTFNTGLRLPAGFAATGKAILSTLADDAVRALYDDNWHEALTAHSIKNCSDLIAELYATRQRGYSIDDCQIRDGMFCIGVAVFDYTNRANNGIALSLPKREVDTQTIQRLGLELTGLAAALSRRLGAAI